MFRGFPDVPALAKEDAQPMNGMAAHQELVRPDLGFRYERSDIPAGQTLAEWRRSRARLQRRTRRAFLPFRSFRAS